MISDLNHFFYRSYIKSSIYSCIIFANLPITISNVIGQYNISGVQNGNYVGQNEAQQTNNTTIFGSNNGVTPLTENNNVSINKDENEFLKYYSRQGAEFSGIIYAQEGKKLVKKRIFTNKTIVVFFGEWCTNCHTFLQGFAQHVETLRLSGIHIIFISVPKVEEIKNWKEPTIDDLNRAENKIASYGVKLLYSSVEVGLLGNSDTLAKNGIKALPTILLVKNGKEYYNGATLNISDQQSYKHVLEVLDNSIESNAQNNNDYNNRIFIPDNNKINNTEEYQLNNNNDIENTKDSNTQITNKIVDIMKANQETEKLNRNLKLIHTKSKNKNQKKQEKKNKKKFWLFSGCACDKNNIKKPHSKNIVHYMDRKKPKLKSIPRAKYIKNVKVNSGSLQEKRSNRKISFFRGCICTGTH